MKRPGRQQEQPGKRKRMVINLIKPLARKKTRWNHTEWKHAFQPIQRRILLRHMLWYLSAGILSALVVALLLSGLSFLIPLELLWVACLIFGLATAATVLLIGWYKRPSSYEAARITDGMGLQEKVLTACELDDRDDEIANLQRKDAIASLSGFDKRRISLRVPKYHGYAFVLLAAAFVLINLIPNPMDGLLRQRKELRAEIQEQLDGLKETEKKLAVEETLTKEQRQELAGLVEELAEQLKKTGDYKEALKDISRAEEQLAVLTDKIREESIGQLAEQLGALGETQALAQALLDRNLAGLENELEQLGQQLEQAANKDELMDALKEALEKAAESMTEGDIKTSLAAASNSLDKGESKAAVDQLGKALNQAVHASNSMGDAKYALQRMRSSIAQAAGDARYAQNAGSQTGQNSNTGNQNTGDQNTDNQSNGNSGQGSSSGQNGQNGEGIGSGEGQGPDQGQGQGSGEGQSQGQGQGSGSGVGSGSTNQSSGQSGSGTTGDQDGNHQMGEESAQTVYEQIYAPERLGDGGEITHVPGQPTGDGNTITEDDGRGIGDLSGFIPYQDVYQEYRNQAMNSMDRRVLPPGVQEMVREYFDALGQ